MKELQFYFLFLLLVAFTGCKEHDFRDLLDRQTGKQEELQALSDMCSSINADIRSLQIVVDAGFTGNYVTGVEESADGSGYVVRFSENDPITIRHGRKGETGVPGKPGMDGEDGKDGEDATIDGTDGKDGQNGQDGTDGKDGQDGEDGKDGQDGKPGRPGNPGVPGKPGVQGEAGDSPVVGVVQDPADREYYWTIRVGAGDAGYLTDEAGNRVKAFSVSDNGLTPQIGVRQWEVADGGDDRYYWSQKIGDSPEEWILAGGQKVRASVKDGISVFDTLIYKDRDYAEFVLMDGVTKFKIPKSRPGIYIQNKQKVQFFRRGETQRLTVKWVGVDPALLKMDVPHGWTAVADIAGGGLTVTAPEAAVPEAALSGTIRLRCGIAAEGMSESALPVTLLYRIPVPDFKGSFVYDILLGGEKTGEFCREYLPGYSHSEAGTVVYPYTEYGSYTTGTVLNNGGRVEHDGTGYTASDKGAVQYVYTEDGTAYYLADTLVGKEPGFGEGVKPQVLTDIEKNIYRIVKIGPQYWMADNLRTCTDKTGKPLITGLSGPDWELNGHDGGKGACAVYDFPDAKAISALENRLTYGVLYNRNAVESVRPEGWQLPSETDYLVLTGFLGGKDHAGKLLKEAGTATWQTTSAEVTDVTGFAGRGGGYRVTDGTAFTGLKSVGYWWSSTSAEGNYYVLKLEYNTSRLGLTGAENNSRGYNIRCLKTMN